MKFLLNPASTIYNTLLSRPEVGFKANTIQKYRITIRATDESVPPALMKIMEDKYSQGHLADLE